MKDLTASLRQISNIIKKCIDITDEAGNIIFSSDCTRIGSRNKDAKRTNSIHNSIALGLYIHMDGSSVEEIGLAKLILKDLIAEVTADNYQQLLINIMDGHKYSGDLCSKFHIPVNRDYKVYCVSEITDEHFHDTYTLVWNSFYESSHIWVFPYDNNIVLLTEADNLNDNTSQTANTIKDMINSEMYIDVCIGVGNSYAGLFNISKSYIEAKEAIRVGKKFNYPYDIYIYKDLLTERIISSLTKESLKEFISEMLARNIDEALNEEMVKTIQVMFKNNLNISDSSRALYIHRNTLLYRIEKIQKITGIDIRKFEDAVVLKLYLIMQSINIDID